MALDVGFKRIGVALSDPLGLTAYPYAVIERKSNRETFEELLKIIDEKRVSELIVGLPISSDGRKTKMAEKIEKFTEKLKTFLKERGREVKISFFDEYLTTAEARELKKEREVVDDIAAAIILTNYLNETNQSRNL